MKRKELKNLAKKIAKAELVVQNSDDILAITRAHDEIIELSGRVSSIEDMVELDDMIQEILQNS